MFLLLMSNEEWSDDEDTNIEPQPDRMFPPSDSESEEDLSEYNKLILSKISDDNYNFFKEQPKKEIIPKEKKEKKEQKSNKMNINWSDFIKEKPKEKKWLSKRMEEKKLKDGKIKYTRQFNPRLPIPTRKKKFSNKNNSHKYVLEDFPEL